MRERNTSGTTEERNSITRNSLIERKIKTGSLPSTQAGKKEVRPKGN